MRLASGLYTILNNIKFPLAIFMIDLRTKIESKLLSIKQNQCVSNVVLDVEVPDALYALQF